MMSNFKNITLNKWIFTFILITGLVPALISAKTLKKSSTVPAYLKINFYSMPPTSEQFVKDSIVDNSLPWNAIKNNADETWNRNIPIPEGLYPCLSGQTTSCDPSDPYRTLDGSCNNLDHPTWGTANECYLRFQPASYKGFEAFQRSKNGYPLVPARDLVQNIFKDFHRPSPNVSFMFTIYGQTVAHDVSLSENLNIISTCCQDPPVHEACIAIPIRENDSFYSVFNVTCLELHRTQSCEVCNNTKRQQVNGVTAALDASMVYGVNKKRSTDVRANDGTGKLLVSSTENGEMLPEDRGRYGAFCRQKKNTTCFFAGDVRVNQHFFLTGISTYFMREHNRIATKLKKMNPNWSEEKLFQEARRINTAILQCITYREYLPVLLGPHIMQQLNLTVENGPDGSKYNPNIPLGVSNEFSTAAFRLHSMIPKEIGTKNLRFKDFYSNPEVIQDGHMEILMQGSYKVPSDEYDQYYVDDVTNYMAKRRGMPYGLDLGSLDIQRGRDHGLAPYIDMVRFCSQGRVNIKTFDDLAPLLMTKKRVEMLKEHYADVGDIDLFVGIQMENLYPGSVVGPTTNCINALQFYSLKYGDRFFFEHEGEVPSFTPAQRTSLRHCSLSRILCDNSNITHVQRNAMLLPSFTNPEVPCEDIPENDLSLWKENPFLENFTSLTS